MARSMERALVVWQHRRDELDAQLDALDIPRPHRTEDAPAVIEHIPTRRPQPNPSPNSNTAKRQPHAPDPYPTP